MQQQEESAEAKLERRKLKQAKYAWEDYQEAIGRFGLAGKIALVLAAAELLSSLVFGAANWPYAVGSALVGGGFFYLAEGVKWDPSVRLIMGGICYLILLFGCELLAFGLPDVLIPALSGDGGWVGVLVIFNDISPYVYIGLRVLLVFPFVQVYLARQKLDALPATIRERTRPARK